MKDPVMVPLVGIMFGNVIGGVTNFLAYRFDMTQALSTWLVGHFSLVLRGNFELVYLVLPLIVLAWILPSTSTSSAWAAIFRRTSALTTRSSFSAVSLLPR